MDPAMGEFLGVMVKLVGLLLGATFAFAMGLFFFLDIYIKKMSHGHVWCFFWANRYWEPMLLREDLSEHCVWVGYGDKKEKYNLRDGKQGWARWPLMTPRMLQVPIRTYEFFRNQSDARAVVEEDEGSYMPGVDPREIDSESGMGMNARVNMMITDEAMVKQTWKDVRRSLGLPEGRTALGSNMTILALGLGVLALLVGLNVYLSSQNNQILNRAFPPPPPIVAPR